MRVETIGNCELYLGDAREVVECLPRKHRLVVSDVPYRLTSGGPAPSAAHKKMSGGWMKDYSNDGKVVICDISWPEIFDVVDACLEEDAEAYVMANDKNLTDALTSAKGGGFQVHNILVWDKVSATANRWYMKNCEFSLYLFRGRARRIADCSSKQLVRLPQRDETDHPTEKPVPLMMHYIENSIRAGEAVIDPFMGSGTTGVACQRLGVPFTGIEIDEKHFETACRRLEQLVRTGGAADLFRERAS